MGVICTNLVNELGHHLVRKTHQQDEKMWKFRHFFVSEDLPEIPRQENHRRGKSDMYSTLGETAPRRKLCGFGCYGNGD